MMKKIFFLLAFVLILGGVRAERFTFTVASGQTLSFETNSSTNPNSVNVSYGSERPTGDLVIPSSVTYNGTTYQVTEISSFRYCTELTSVVIPSSVTVIPRGVFYYCDNLITVTLPSTLDTIYENAFERCPNLMSINLPSGLTAIQSGAFYGCSSLAVDVPSSVGSIAADAFEKVMMVVYHGSDSGAPWGATMMNLAYDNDFIYLDDTKRVVKKCRKQSGEVTMPNTVEGIASDAFSYNSVTVNLPNSLTWIGDSAFHSYKGTSLVIPNSVQYIGQKAFLFSDIKSLTLPNSVRAIGRACFMSSRIEEIVLPNSLTTIPEGAFIYCTRLKSLAIPAQVATIGDSAFCRCHSFTNVIIPNSVSTIGYNAFYEVEHIDYYGLATGAPWGASSMNGYREGDFYYSDNTKTKLVGYMGNGGAVTIPATVQEIGDGAFVSCSTLTSVVIPASVTRVGKIAFYNCTNLKSVSLAEGLMSIDSAAFYQCDLISVTLPNSLTHLGKYAFAWCSSLSVTIGNGLDTISDFAFSDCAQVAGWGSRVRVIGEGAFKYSKMVGVAIPNTVTEIGKWAFYSCSKLKNITIPSSVTTIGEWAFGYCRELGMVEIPSQVATIGEYAFREVNCIEYHGSATGARWGALSMNVYRDGDYVYKNSRKNYLLGYLGNDGVLTIPSSVDTIGDTIFGSKVGNVYVHNTVDWIGKGAFVNILRGDVFINDVSPGDKAEGAICSWVYNIYVPCNALNFFQNDGYWTDVADQIKAYDKTYKLVVKSNDINMGIAKVSQPADCDTRQATITASANIGYRFVGWNDGNTDRTRTVTLYSNQTYTATFAPREYQISIKSMDTTMGTVVIDEAEPTVQVGNGIMRARTIPMNNYFKNATTESLWLASEIGQSGRISGLSFYVDLDDGVEEHLDYNDLKIYLGTTLQTGLGSGWTGMNDLRLVYHRQSGRMGGSIGWEDFTFDTPFEYDGTSNLVVVVSHRSDSYNGNLYYQVESAQGKSRYAGLDTDTNYSKKDYVAQNITGSLINQRANVKFAFDNTPHYGDNIQFAAVPKPNYRFWRWSDDDTDSSRVKNVYSDINLTAYFMPEEHAREMERGQQVGRNTEYRYATVRLHDSLLVFGTCDTVATETQQVNDCRMKTLTVQSGIVSAPMGWCSGSGQYPQGSSAQIMAIPYSGYRFVSWSDGNRDNPRTVFMDDDKVIDALFEEAN